MDEKLYAEPLLLIEKRGPEFTLLPEYQQQDVLATLSLPVQLGMPLIVAEIGGNHCGSVAIAEQMIAAAKGCGAHVVKFQKRTPRELLTPEQYAQPYDNPHSYGTTYGAHREALEFSRGTHRMLMEVANGYGIDYSVSVWDMTSAYEMIELNPGYIKVPSACNNHLRMLEALRDDYAGEVHISTGMSTEEEVEQAVAVFERCPERVVLYACVSGYPIAFDDVCLLEIPRLAALYQQTGRVKSIGFSGHHNGIAIDTIAMVLGASVIERHFTLDRAWRGSDHAASLEPQGFSRLVRDLNHTVEAWAFKSAAMMAVELPQRTKLKYRAS